MLNPEIDNCVHVQAGDQPFVAKQQSKFLFELCSSCRQQHLYHQVDFGLEESFLPAFLPAFLESLLPAFLLHREVAALVFLCRHCQLLRGGNLL